ncbi:acyl-CoA thioesterase [Altericista sp. CCNU0014]|uniref:acyl-CoA thioesterase n=1 Tax=Altericista sp. CCNU0014 TaxID=3082949 RepID=UPI00384B3133
MPFIYSRRIRFQDTDAAGVVYFANTLAICHEAYEESLIAAGVEVWKFFSSSAIALPIVHAEANYRHPAFCGDLHEIVLTPVSTSHHGFEIRYEIYGEGDRDRLISQALTRHVCINPVSRERQPLPQQVLGWLKQWR